MICATVPAKPDRGAGPAADRPAKHRPDPPSARV